MKQNSITVTKIGGGVLGPIENFEHSYINPLRIVQRESLHRKALFVFSAFSGVTRKLSDEAIYSHHSYPGQKLYDLFLSKGENDAVRMLYERFSSLPEFKGRVGYFSRENIPIITDDTFGNANITLINTAPILEAFERFDIIFFPGFMGHNVNNYITTLGSNGSDTTAIALSAALDGECVIIKDSGAVYTADPKLIKEAVKLDTVNLTQANILASLGSPIIHAKGAAYAEQSRMPIIVRSIDGLSETRLSLNTPKSSFAGITSKTTIKGIKISVVGKEIGWNTAYNVLKSKGYNVIQAQTPYGNEASAVLFKIDAKEAASKGMQALHSHMLMRPNQI